MSGVKCTSDWRRCARRMTSAALVLCLSAMVLTGCSRAPEVSFQSNASYSNFNFLIGESGSAEVAEPFAENLCVVNKDKPDDPLDGMNSSAAAALFDLKNKKTLYARNTDTRLYPASLTKVMTALVAMQNKDLDTVLTASPNIYISDADAQIAGLKPGDTMTLDQALHILLIYSANDIAVLIAENVAGSVDDFVKMMNDEAKALGATNTNFVNANGLSDSNHYTSAYDMYLIFNAAIQYDEFQQIINMSSYSTVYHDKNGANKEIKVNSTNYYLIGATQAPTGVTVIGGKTGTTDAAGHCLVLYCKDTSGNPYISVVMRAVDNDELYSDMNGLLELIPAP